MSTPEQLTEHFLLAARGSEARALGQLVHSCQLVAAVCELVHELQRERGISNVFLASAGQEFADELKQQYSRTDTANDHFCDYLQRVQSGQDQLWSSARLYHRIAHVLLQLKDLAELRNSIEQGSLTTAQATEAWSGLIAELLSVLFEIADIAADAEISRALVALFHFLQAKEHTGQERAWGCVGFAAEAFDTEILARLQHLRESQQRCLDVFVRFAEPEEVWFWEQLEQAPAKAELVRMRKVIDALGEGAAVPHGVSETWFAVATARIDGMRELEEQLSADLQAMAGERLEKARKALQDNRSRLEAEPPAEPVSAFSLLLDASSDSEQVPAAGSVRALYDLLQEQADHLQQVSDQLEEARSALTERKLVERAKGLMMQYQKMTEEEAFASLRRAAMEGNCRLIDVAARVVAAAEKLKG